MELNGDQIIDGKSIRVTAYTNRPNDRLFGGPHIVMPAEAGIHDLTLSQPRKSWIPAFAGMTERPVVGNT